MEFNFNTIKDFDKHIELSIPNYTHIHELIKAMSTYFIKPSTNVYDIGCSTGSLLEKLSDSPIHNVKYIGYDNSENFKPSLKTKKWHWILGDINNADETPMVNSSLILSIFTLQFLSIKDRWRITKEMYNSLNLGGAFIICEKVYIKEGFMQDLFTFSYYDYKKKSFTEKEILDKQNDLRLIMQPQTEEQNKIMFREAGFTNVETFFSSLFFKGWVLCK